MRGRKNFFEDLKYISVNNLNFQGYETKLPTQFDKLIHKHAAFFGTTAL